jgi:hypothetical protein
VHRFVFQAKDIGGEKPITPKGVDHHAKLEAGRCARLLSSDEKDWIALLKAVSIRDAGAMVRGAKSILEAGKE